MFLTLLNIRCMFIILYKYKCFYMQCTKLYRESDRDGQVEDGVRVALLKLVTDGSRPIGEISDN